MIYKCLIVDDKLLQRDAIAMHLGQNKIYSDHSDVRKWAGSVSGIDE